MQSLLFRCLYEEESKRNLNIFLLTEYVQIGLKTLRHFSTQSPPRSMQVCQRFTNAWIPREKNSSDWLRSHLCTASFISSSVLNSWGVQTHDNHSVRDPVNMQDVEYTPNADPWFSLLSHELCAGVRYHAVTTHQNWANRDVLTWLQVSSGSEADHSMIRCC
jgi:hypothetical protein